MSPISAVTEMGDRLATIDMGRKEGGAAGLHLTQCGLAWAEAYLHVKFHLGSSNRLATIHQRHRQTDRTDRQRSDSIRRTVLQTVAQKCEGFYLER